MSRTYRNNSPRRGRAWTWLVARNNKGDSKPFAKRFVTEERVYH